MKQTEEELKKAILESNKKAVNKLKQPFAERLVAEIKGEN